MKNTICGLLTIAAVLLGGCSHDVGSLTGTVSGSPNLHTPKYAVRGKTAYDQRWINVTTEALVDGFGQPRPKPRPPELDKVTVKNTQTGNPVVVKKRWWRQKGTS